MTRHTHARSGRLRGLFARHDHGVAEQLDDALECSALGIRTTRFTLAVLATTAVLQLVIALLSGSVALLADTVHNAADAMTSIPLWIAFVIGRRIHSRRYPYGLRRAEDLAGVFILLMIAVSAVWIGWESIARLLEPTPMRHTGWVFAAGVIGVVGNEAAAIVRIRVGRRIGSVALVADGYHARTDTIASFGVIVAVIGSWLGWPLLDPVVGLVITVLIVWILWTTAGQVLRRLLDGVDPEVLTRIEQAAAEVDGVDRVGSVRARWSGHRLFADLTVTVGAECSLAEGHRIGERVRHHLLHAVGHLEDAWVHVDPSLEDDADPHAITEHHRR